MTDLPKPVTTVELYLAEIVRLLTPEPAPKPVRQTRAKG